MRSTIITTGNLFGFEQLILRKPMNAPSEASAADDADGPTRNGRRKPGSARSVPNTAHFAHARRPEKLGSLHRRIIGVLAFVMGLGSGLHEAGAMQAAPK